MKLHMRGMFAATVIVALILLVSVHVACAYLFGVKRILYRIDSRFSPQVQHEIVAFFDAQLHSGNSVNGQFFGQAQQHFPYIKTIVAQRVAPDVLHVEVTAQQPLLALNQTALITDGGYIVPKDFFVASCTKGLHTVSYPGLGQGVFQAHQGLASCASLLAYDICKRYSVTWHHDVEAWLCDKTQPQFAIVCSAATLPKSCLLTYCNHLKSELEVQGNFQAQRKKQWVVDIRFDKQMVMSCKKGEADGKVIC